MTHVSPTGALPMPSDGMRRLTPKEIQQRAQAMSCLRESNSKCQGQVYVNLFFDGTGNNWNWNGPFTPGKKVNPQTQSARDSHTNVVRLFRASYNKHDNGLFSFYIPGVGTPFAEIGDSGAGLDGSLGAAAGRFGANRINWGIIQVLNAMHQYLTEDDLITQANIQDIVHRMSLGGVSDADKKKESDKENILYNDLLRLKKEIDSRQKKIKSVNISVFGFSRGAAEARTFVHWLFERAQTAKGSCDYHLAGIPISLKFLGIFDTVASVGLASISRIADGRTGWASGELMSIHPEVKKCVHFVALHEQRINFPSDLATQGKQILYPGMHSDVGGGYSPSSQGKSSINSLFSGAAKLSQIPLLDMHYEALKAGVPLRTLEEINQEPDLSRQFACHPKLIIDYNSWLANHAVPAGDHENQIKGHSRQYIQWKGLRLQEGPENEVQQAYYKLAAQEDKDDLDDARRNFGSLIDAVTTYREDREKSQKAYKDYEVRLQAWEKGGRKGPRPLPRRVAALTSTAEDHELFELLDLILQKKSPPKNSIRLFDHYVHDSIAGFYIKEKTTELTFTGFKTNGYLRYRTLFNINSEKSKNCEVKADKSS